MASSCNPFCALRQSGFTLVEMSMVLVIIGLILGGLVVGQSLIRQSQLNSVMSDEQRFVQAIQNFQQKYGALPGDMPNATKIWGDWTSAGGTCPPTNASLPTGSYTCNGDGNGEIAMTGQWTNNWFEMFLTWQHLALANMLTGSYTGGPGSGGAGDHVPGTNCPASKIKGAGYGISFQNYHSGDTYWYDGNWGHQIIFGGYLSGNWPANPIITAAEAASLDSKYDDGSPTTGIISTLKPAGISNCATDATSSAQYKVTQKGNACLLLFTTGF